MDHEHADDDCATLVFQGQPFRPHTESESAPESQVTFHPPENPPESHQIQRPALATARSVVAEVTKASMVSSLLETPPSATPTRPALSLWNRFTRGASRFYAHVAETFWGILPPLSNELPPVPPARSAYRSRAHEVEQTPDERAEALLLALLALSPRYQRAAIATLRRALRAQREGKDAHTEFVVHFAISRTREDAEGRIPVHRIREKLSTMAFAGELLPALIRLEEQNIIGLVLDPRRSDPMDQMLRTHVTHIEPRISV